jgi:sec-independent protein translocase protein TatA
MGADLGGAVKGFKEGMKEASSDKPDAAAGDSKRPEGNIIEGEIKEKSKST